MRVLSPTLAALVAGDHLDAVWLLEITWPDATVGRYADRAVQVDADTYAAAIARWDPIDFPGGREAQFVTTIELAAQPGGALWTDLRGREVAGAVLRVGLYAVGSAAADVLWFLGGDLAAIENVPGGISRLRIRSILAGLPPELPLHIVDLDTFPDAPPDTVGRALPLLYGTLPAVPIVPVRAAAMTRLRGSAAGSSTSLDVEDAAGPPAFPAGDIILRIDDEYLLGSFAGNRFTITTRGADATAEATADGGSPTTVIDAARTEPDATWVNFVLRMTGGTPANLGVERVITAFEAATGTLTVEVPFPADVAAGDTYLITTRAADHLHGAVVELVGEDHVFLVADHPCADVTDPRLNGEQMLPADVRIDRNDTTTFPQLGRAVTTLTTRGRPRVKRFAEGSRFLLTRFDEDAGSSPGVAWGNAIDPRVTFVAQLNGTQPLLKLRQATDMTDGPARFGTLRRVFLTVHFRQDRVLLDDTVEIEWNGTPLGTLDPTQPVDHTGGGGEVDLVHTHPQDLSHPVAPLARTHDHLLPGAVRQVDTDTVTGVGFSAGSPKVLSRTTTPPHSTAETIQATAARFTIAISSTPAGFNPFGIFRLHYHLPYGPWLVRDSVTGTLTLNVVGDTSASLSQWAQWPEPLNKFEFWVENVLASQIVVETFTGLWEVTIAPRLSDPSSTFLETETTELPPVSLDGSLAPVMNAEEMLSVVYENSFDLSLLVAGDWSALNAGVAQARYTVNGADDGVQVYIASLHLDVEFAPFTYETTGDLTVQVSGVESAGDGTGTLLTNPADVLTDLLTARLGLASTRLDVAGMAQAALDAAARGARWDFALTTRGSALTLLRRMAAEAGGTLAEANGMVALRLDPLLDAPPAALLTARTRADEAPPVSRRGLDTVTNSQTWLFAQDYRRRTGRAPVYGNSVTVEETDSVAAFHRRTATGALRLVRDPAWAAALGVSRLAARAWPGLECAWPAYWHHLAAERGDVVWLSDPTLGFVDLPGRVVAEQITPGAWADRTPDRATLVVQLAPWRLLRVFDPTTWLAWSHDGLRYVVDGVTVARLTLAGDWWLAGGFIRHAGLAPGDPANFESYDSATRTLFYSDAAGTRLLELDAGGTVRVAGVEQINAPLGTTTGPEGTGVIGGQVEWARGGAAPAFARLATLSADRWRVAGRLIQHRVFPITT